MPITNKWEPVILLFGDILAFILALWSALFLRYGEVPSMNLFIENGKFFFLVGIIWLIVFLSAGLYDKQTLILKRRLPTLLFNAQLVNTAIAVLFFYLFPVPIAPKTILFLELILSFMFILIWRSMIAPFIGFREREKAIIVASGGEVYELIEEVNNNDRYRITFVKNLSSETSSEEVYNAILSSGATIAVIDINGCGNSISIDEMSTRGIEILDFSRVYEDAFERIPLSSLNQRWFMDNVSGRAHWGYDIFKRIFDIILSIPLLLLAAIFWPIVALGVFLEDRGPTFISQERIGRYGRRIRIFKFRTMEKSDSGAWLPEGKNKVTKVGNVLRLLSIDELPQAWNVILGDLSLIGPRSDIVDLGTRLLKEIPFYSMRNLISPGITGWAQTHQAYSPGKISPQSVEETRHRLAYDLYYLKNRSFMLDLKIALQTVTTLLSRIKTALDPFNP